MSRPLLIFGARIFAEEIADLASELGIEVAGLVENLDREPGPEHDKMCAGLPIHWIDDVAARASTHDAICGLGTTARRSYIEQVEAMGFPFRSLIHPSAMISPSARIGGGCIINRGAILGAHVRIGCHTIMNRGAMVGHHTVIGDYCTLGPGVNIAGLCRIGDQVWMGMSATIVDRTSVGENARIAAGAFVTKDIEAGRHVAGSPARVVRA